MSIAAGDENYDYYVPEEETITTEQAMDLLMADDPAYYSDEFSNPDDYYYENEDSDSYDDLSHDNNWTLPTWRTICVTKGNEDSIHM